MAQYRVLVNRLTYEKALAYLKALQAGKSAGRYVQEQLFRNEVAHMSVEAFLEVMMRTKLPLIFAESAVTGNGSDWTPDELSILGDIGVATPVIVYDNGEHQHPTIHTTPFPATLLFIPGALLQSGGSHRPADWDEVVTHNTLNSAAYHALYHRRLYPLFMYANATAKHRGTSAFITVPGLGCGQFAGRFQGQLGEELKQALITFLERYGHEFSHIRGVYYDPYRECTNERHLLHHIHFLVRPLMQGNADKPQLCHPQHYAEQGDHFAECDLFSVVAWDHVSWPGNDFYGGSRATDDGVKAAATNAMAVMTGVEGRYDPQHFAYRPPAEYRNWEDVVMKNHIELDVQENLELFFMPNAQKEAR